MAWNNSSDSTSANQDDLDSKASNNLVPSDHEFGPSMRPKGKRRGFAKISSANTSGSVKVSKGIGTRKSTSAPRGSGRKGSTTKGNALKNA